MIPIERRRYLVQLVEDFIAEYRSGGKTLGELSSDLYSLTESLKEVADVSWTEDFRTCWGEIEIVNAVNLDSGRTTLTEDQDRRVREAIDELLTHVQTW
jgi:hypothetical protein